MPDNLVTLGVYNTAFEAQMDKNLLEENGIAAGVAEDQTGIGAIGTFRGGVRLLVSEADAARAELILSLVREEHEVEEEDTKSASEEFATTRTCSECGQSFDVAYKRCPNCAPSEEFFEGEPSKPTASLTPLGPEDEVKDAPYSRGDEYASRALLVSLLTLFLGQGAVALLALYSGTLITIFGGLSFPLVFTAWILALVITVGPHLYVLYLVVRFFFYEGETRRSSEYKSIAAGLISGGIICLFVLRAISLLT